MIKREKSFSSFSYYVHHVMIKSEKAFFHLATTLTTPRIRKKKEFSIQPLRLLRLIKSEKKFFSFSHYVACCSIFKREKRFFYLATTLTTPRSRKKGEFSIQPLRLLCHDQERKNAFFIQLLRSLRHDQEEKRLFFIYPLPCLLRHDQETKTIFSFSHYAHYAKIKKEKRLFNLATTFTTP